MSYQKKIIISSILALVILYGGFYIYNLNTAPKIVTKSSKYIAPEDIHDLMNQSELIAKVTKIDEKNLIYVTHSSTDSTIKYEDPYTETTFKIEKVYLDKKSKFKVSDEFVLEEFAGYHTNHLTGEKTLVTPEDYELTKKGNSYLVAARESKTSPGKYVLIGHIFGKYALDHTERKLIYSKITGDALKDYQEIEKKIKELYK